MKKKFVDAHMSVAEIYSKLSSAKRLKVGCVAIKNDTVIGIGYNGMPSGWDNDCEEKVWDKTGDYTLKTKPEVIHAEINCLSKISRSTNSSENADMFITHAPCVECAKAIFQSGIRKVFYRNDYRDDSGLNFLKKCGVEIEKV